MSRSSLSQNAHQPAIMPKDWQAMQNSPLRTANMAEPRMQQHTPNDRTPTLDVLPEEVHYFKPSRRLARNSSRSRSISAFIASGSA
jgi:hypothetical protein